MKLPQLSLNTIFRSLLILVLVALAYYASDILLAFLDKHYPAAMHGVAVGGGVFLAALSLLIAWGEMKKRTLITDSPHGQKKPVLVVLLPAGTLLMYGACLAAIGLSYWWGQVLENAAGFAIIAALLMTGFSLFIEQRTVQAQKP